MHFEERQEYFTILEIPKSKDHDDIYALQKPSIDGSKVHDIEKLFFGREDVKCLYY